MKNHCDFHFGLKDRIISVLNQVNCISCKGRLFSGLNNAKSIEAFTTFWCFLNMVWDSFSKNSFSALNLLWTAAKAVPHKRLPAVSAFNIFLPHPLFRFCSKLQVNISAFTYKNKYHDQSVQTSPSLLECFKFWCKDKKGALKNPLKNPSLHLLHPILSARQGAGLFPTEIKQIALDVFFWKLQLPSKKGVFLPSVLGIYTHLHPLPFPSYLVAITLISRV